jgi:hypothetical protein
VRLKAGIWVSAYLRRCTVEGAYATLRRRGAEEAGAIFVVVDRLDGQQALFGPAPQSEIGDDGVERLWTRMHVEDWLDPSSISARLQREIAFDPDIWIIDVEDRAGRNFLDLASGA